MSKRDHKTQTSNIAELYGIIHDLRPLLKQSGTWTLADVEDSTGVDQSALRGPLQRCIRGGAIKQIEKERSGGSWHWRYRWFERPKDRLETYLSEMDTLTCDCRCHIPDGRDYPDGWVRCKHCGVAHERDWFMEFVEGKL